MSSGPKFCQEGETATGVNIIKGNGCFARWQESLVQTGVKDSLLGDEMRNLRTEARGSRRHSLHAADAHCQGQWAVRAETRARQRPDHIRTCRVLHFMYEAKRGE